jgi:hypothetical protein
MEDKLQFALNFLDLRFVFFGCLAFKSKSNEKESERVIEETFTGKPILVIVLQLFKVKLRWLAVVVFLTPIFN